MKKIYKYSLLSLLILWIIFWSFKIFAAEDDNSWYQLYLSRNAELCTEYKPSHPIYTSENNYIDISSITDSDGNSIWESYAINGNDLEVAQQQYKTTMNNIYKCALLSAQERSLNSIMEKSELSTSVNTSEYEAKLARLEASREVNNCGNANSSQIVNDLPNVIDQTIFEICKYNNYLEYLFEYNSVIANVIEQDKKSLENTTSWTQQVTQSYNIWKIADLEKQKKAAISEEIEKAYEIYPIALQAYKEYENNLPIHDLLSLFKDDLIEYRLELHKNLTPINQVVYKISNAMKE